MAATPDGISANRSSPLFVAAVLAIALLGVLLEYPNKVAVFGADRVYFEGPDDYMRTWRARQIADGSVVRIRHIAEINFPAGAELHWTAPMDYLLAGAGRVFGGLAGRADSFGAVAAMVPLGLGVIYLLYMARVMRRGFGISPALLTAVVIILTPPWHSTFCVGHPDHHCLLALFLLLAVGPWIPQAKPDRTPGEPRRGAAVCSGVAIGAAIWVSVEAMAFWLAMVAAIWTACTFGPLEEQRAHARAKLAWNVSAILTVMAGWLFENWPEVGGVAADKISLLHVMILAIGFFIPARAVATEARQANRYDETTATPWRYSGWSQLARCIAFLVVLAVFTSWLAFGHNRVFEHVSRPEFSRWISRLMEFQPLYIHAGSRWSLRPLHSLLGFVPYALPVLLIFFLRCRQISRVAKCALAILAPAVMLLSIVQMRWIDHVDLAIMPVAVVGVWELVRFLSWRAGETRVEACGFPGGVPAVDDALAPSRRPSPSRFNFPWAVLVSAAVLALLLYPAVGTMWFYGIEEARQAGAFLRRTDFVARQITASERQHSDRDRRRRAILCEEGEGPALLYWTGLPVVATPYHRALDGLLEMARFFAERDPIAAREQLDRMGVGYVVLPPRANEQLMQFEEMAFGGLRSFDPPDRSIDEFGRENLKLNYRSAEVRQTMAYRLVIESNSEVIPGVECIARISEGAKTAEGQSMKTGLLYVVHDRPPASQAASQAARE